MSALENKIMHSLNGLYGAIEQAHLAVQDSGYTDLVERLSHYMRVVEKQKSVAASLRRYYLMGDFIRLKKQAELIQDTARLIQLDVLALITEIQQRKAA